MKKEDYAFEVEYILVMANWRWACDERGLSLLCRSLRSRSSESS